MRNMSFSLTTEQVKNKTKTVTRRNGWTFLTEDTTLQPVKKGMGLKKGEKVEKIGLPIGVTSVKREPLSAITLDDVVKEGFPKMTTDEFIKMYCKANIGWCQSFIRLFFDIQRNTQSRLFQSLSLLVYCR